MATFLTRATNLVFDGVLTVIYPQICRLCGSSVESRVFGAVCEVCWNKTRIFTGAEVLCARCGVLGHGRINSEHQSHCGRCGAQAFATARACGIYEGALRESVLLLKRQPHIAKHLESLIISSATRLDQCSLLIPVPLHSDRLRSRGFNQAAAVAGIVSKALALPVSEASLVRERTSEKYRAGLDARGRLETVASVFAIHHPRLVAGEDVLLVDDVLTTGATASACAEVLLSAGARSVAVFTIARSPW